MQSAERFPERPAVFAEGRTLSYHELQGLATRIAATIQAHPGFSQVPLTAVFGYRSPTAFAGVLGALLAGNGYVPLNRTFPPERTEVMFERSECRSIVVDTGSLHQLGQLLDRADAPLLVMLPDALEVREHRERWPRHAFFGFGDLYSSGSWQEPSSTADAIAYLLFTSGSTGIPKGVMVTHRNVTSYLDYMVDRYEITERDRLSQMFDMTFDLSVFDMFMAWERGAYVCCPSQKTLIKPGKFVRDMALTVWFSVPSTVAFMKQLGMLKPRQYESLRLSLFCGEPLPVSSAAAWLEAAPNSILENLYGPTELTISCTLYRWDPILSPSETELEVVPIGYPHPGMNVLVANQNLNEVPPGEEGELLMNGPQMSLGYWKDPEKTAASFVIPPGKSDIYYRTGDRVRRPIGSRPLTHLGRTDFQVKVLGHRVELGEIEAVIRKVSGLEGVIAVGWPVTSSGCSGIEVFLEGEAKEKEWLRKAVASALPEYMVPRGFHFMNRLPRNVNDKFDRKAILKLLEHGA
ncbi:MAG TPA: amino acid adenylation domain-containing protein [Terriglobales bacterium]|nr:amino acid adenylation domain-containing protein [Terriglobales bacterium]